MVADDKKYKSLLYKFISQINADHNNKITIGYKHIRCYFEHAYRYYGNLILDAPRACVLTARCNVLYRTC